MELNAHIESPIIELMGTLGLTRHNLADISGVAVTTVEYTEKAMHFKIPPDILAVIGEYDPDIENKYAKYQITKRFQWNGPKVLPEGFPDLSDITHPHVEWRQIVCGLSLNEYSAAICVPRFVIQKYESGTQRKFPDALTIALTMACGSQFVQDLTRICADWKK